MAEVNDPMESRLGARYLDELPGDGSVRFADGTGRWAGDWRRGWPVMPLIPILVVLALVGSVVAVAHGQLPLPLLWVALLLLWLRLWGRGPWVRDWNEVADDHDRVGPSEIRPERVARSLGAITGSEVLLDS